MWKCLVQEALSRIWWPSRNFGGTVSQMFPKYSETEFGGLKVSMSQVWKSGSMTVMKDIARVWIWIWPHDQQGCFETLGKLFT